jgi:GAF domain-containing protein
VSFGGDVRAVVGLISETPRTFDDEEVQLVYTLANQASAALAVLEMSTRLSARAEQQTALARAARTLNARLDFTSVLDTLCREANLSLAGDVAGVYLGDAESGGVAVAADGIEGSWHGTVMRAGEGLAGQVLVSGRPVITNAYKEEVRIPSSAALSAVETAVAVPVRWSGELKGALSVGFHSMRAISDEDMGTLEAMADLAAVACSNAEAFEHVQVQARTDSLTGLLNHGALQVRLIEEIARVRRTGGRALLPAARSGRLQADQRSAWPPRGRPDAAPGRRIAAERVPLLRRDRPLRRRRVRAGPARHVCR